MPLDSVHPFLKTSPSRTSAATSDPTGVLLGCLLQPRRIVDGSGSDDYPLDPQVEDLFYRRSIPNTATDLDGGPGGLDYLSDHATVVAKGKGRIQIDDVEGLRSPSPTNSGLWRQDQGGRPSPPRVARRPAGRTGPDGDPRRVRRSYGFSRQGHRGSHFGPVGHFRTSFRKFPMMVRPGAELFSGWNCTPHVFFLRIPAGKTVSLVFGGGDDSSLAIRGRTHMSSRSRPPSR